MRLLSALAVLAVGTVGWLFEERASTISRARSSQIVHMSSVLGFGALRGRMRDAIIARAIAQSLAVLVVGAVGWLSVERASTMSRVRSSQIVQASALWGFGMVQPGLSRGS